MTFSIRNCIEFGWRTFKARPWFFVGLVVIVFAISLVTAFVQGIVADVFGKSLGGLLSLLISIIVDAFIAIGYLHIFLKAHDSVMTPTFGDLWQPQYFLNYIGTYILLFIIVFIGLILLIVPGIILALIFTFATLIVVDRNLKPIEALKESARITKGHRLNLLGLLLVFILVNVLGVLLLVVGLFVSIPVSVLALVHAYRELSSAPASVAAVPETSVPA